MDSNGYLRKVQGLSIVEVLISLVIFGLVMGGLANMILTNKRLILHSRSRSSAGELARFFFDPLQNGIREDQWDNNCVSDTTAVDANCAVANRTLDNRTYTPRYTKSTIAGTEIRKVQLRVSW